MKNKRLMMFIVFVVLAIAACVVLVACMPANGTSAYYGADNDSIKITDYIDRIIDEEAGVVCYKYAPAIGGLSCLPISLTLLDQ